MIENDDEKSVTFSNDALNQNLLEVNVNEEMTMKKPSMCLNILHYIFPCCKKVDTKTKRIVLFRNSVKNTTYWSNKEENHKYSVLFFVPIVLFNQFKQFGNFFYLLLSISQFFSIFTTFFVSSGFNINVVIKVEFVFLS